MAITVDPATKIITVPQADCDFVSGSLYKLPTKTTFRAQVISWLASEEGIVFERAIDHNSEYTVFGVTYAPKVEVINGYSVTFTPNSAWTCLLEESNNNIADVEEGILNPNDVTVVPQNSAGLVVTNVGSGLSAAQDQKLTEIHGELRSIESGEHHSWFMRIFMSALGGLLSGADTTNIKMRDMADTKDRIDATVDADGNRTSITLDGD